MVNGWSNPTYHTFIIEYFKWLSHFILKVNLENTMYTLSFSREMESPANSPYLQPTNKKPLLIRIELNHCGGEGRAKLREKKKKALATQKKKSMCLISNETKVRSKSLPDTPLQWLMVHVNKKDKFNLDTEKGRLDIKMIQTWIAWHATLYSHTGLSTYVFLFCKVKPLSQEHLYSRCPYDPLQGHG